MSGEKKVRGVDKKRKNDRQIEQINICFFVKIMKKFHLSCKRFLDLELITHTGEYL